MRIFQIFHILPLLLLGSCSALKQQTTAPQQYVDLGLTSGTLWATCNIGATNETEAGIYVAWGETEEKETYSRDNYFDANNVIFNATDNASLVGTKYDAAQKLWGEEWVMPTREQAVELYTQCTWKWVADYKKSGVAGCIVTGPNGKSMFIPAGGLKMEDQHNYQTYGNLWIGSLHRYNRVDWARFMDFNSNGPAFQPIPFGNSTHIVSQDYRWWGRNIRAVRKQ